MGEIGIGILRISRVLEHNEDITEHVGLHIKLVSRIIRNDKEDPLSPPCLRAPCILQSHKQMAGCECSSHMSREERKKQSFHLYFAAVTPLRSTSRRRSVIHYNFRIMGIHCGSVPLHFRLPGVLYNTTQRVNVWMHPLTAV